MLIIIIGIIILFGLLIHYLRNRTNGKDNTKVSIFLFLTFLFTLLSYIFPVNEKELSESLKNGVMFFHEFSFSQVIGSFILDIQNGFRYILNASRIWLILTIVVTIFFVGLRIFIYWNGEIVKGLKK